MNASATDSSSRAPHEQLILVSGATGYVGGRLVPRLLAAGHRVRCLVRGPSRLQGRAWLQFETLPQAGGTLLVQTAYFAPKGLPGLLYRYSLYPVHGAIFSGMIAALAAAASRPGGRHGGVASPSA